MKIPLLIVLTAVVVGVGSTLAIMNNACKSSHHEWCAPISDIRHHATIGRS
jgi:multisubunit Na+/H+ antiporter MnhC subunit